MSEDVLSKLKPEQLEKLQKKLERLCIYRKMPPFSLDTNDLAPWRELVLRICKAPKGPRGAPARSQEEVISIFDYMGITSLIDGVDSNEARYALTAEALNVRRKKHKRDGEGSPSQIVKGVLNSKKHKSTYQKLREDNKKEMESWPNEAWLPKDEQS